MWRIDNGTPFAAERGWIRDGDGAEVWIVAVKATYDILPDGGTRVAAEQPPVNSGPAPWPGKASLRYETDLGPSKAATDIVLNGHAYAQSAELVTELLVAFRVGNLTRGARIHGDRHWQSGLLLDSPSEPQAFASMPLDAEHAFGGDAIDARRASGNPVGRGIEPGTDGKIWLPNVEGVNDPVRLRAGRPKPLLFGPVPCHWPLRGQYAGTYDQQWQDSRMPLAAEDLQPAYWQTVVPEQQLPRLHGGEEIALVNLTRPGYAKKGLLIFKLPRLSLAFETHFYDGSVARSRPAIHTVILEPDFPRVSVVHHITLPCHPKVNLLDRTHVNEKRRPLDRPEQAARDQSNPTEGMDT